jgi:hypothetical protein
MGKEERRWMRCIAKPLLLQTTYGVTLCCPAGNELQPSNKDLSMRTKAWNTKALKVFFIASPVNVLDRMNIP